MQLMFMIPLILSSVRMTLGQQADASCCRLDASIGGTNPTDLVVKVVNLQEMPVVVYRTIPEWDLRLRIVGEDGQEPELTEYAKQLLDRERNGSMVMIPLKQGESWAQTLDLRKLYILNKGTYTVTVSRDVFINYEKRIELQTKTNVKVPFDQPQSLQQMVKRADVIVEGRVESIFPGRLPQVDDPGSVETDTLFAVDRVLKGRSELLRSLVITQPGGKYGDLEVLVDDETPLKAGDRHILFLLYDRRSIVRTYPRTDGNFAIVGNWVGNFKVEGGAVKWLSPPTAQTFKKFENGTAEVFIGQILAAVSAAK